MQAEYRARQKEKLGEQYYARETARVKRYYVPSAELRPRDKKLRQEREEGELCEDVDRRTEKRN